MSNAPHWLDLSEYLAIAVAVVGLITAAGSSNWMYAIVPMLISLILNAINRWRFSKNIQMLDRSWERKLDREIHQQAEIFQQEIAQARSFSTALVKQTMSAQKLAIAPGGGGDRSGSLESDGGLAQRFDRQQQLMKSMQTHVTGVEASLKEVVDLLDSNALTDRVEYLERHLIQISGQLGIDVTELDRPVGNVLSFEDEPDVDITPLLDMISEDLMSSEFMSSELMSDNLVSAELSGDLWSKPTWNLVKTISAHGDWVRCLSFTPDSTKLVSGSFDKTIKLWQLDTGKLLQTLGDRQKGVFALAVSPDGKFLASGSWDETIELWNLETGTLLHKLSHHQASVRSLVISPDSKTLISGSFDQTMVIWSLPDGAVIKTMIDQEPIAAIALSADGSFLASTGDDGIVKIWSVVSGTKIAESTGNKHCIGSLAISTDSQSIIAGTVNGDMILWRLDIENGQPPQLSLAQNIKAHAGQINACIFSPDSQSVISGSVDGKAKIWYKNSDEQQFRDKARSILKGDPGRSVMSVAIDARGQIVAIGGADGTIQIWERM